MLDPSRRTPTLSEVTFFTGSENATLTVSVSVVGVEIVAVGGVVSAARAGAATTTLAIKASTTASAGPPFAR